MHLVDHFVTVFRNVVFRLPCLGFFLFLKFVILGYRFLGLGLGWKIRGVSSRIIPLRDLRKLVIVDWITLYDPCC